MYLFISGKPTYLFFFYNLFMIYLLPFPIDICILITLTIFIYGCTESLLLSMGFYWQQAGATLVAVHGLLMEVVSLVEEHTL